MKAFYRQHKTTHERIDNLAQRLSRKAGRKVSSRDVQTFAEERKFFPEIIGHHRCFPIGVADIIFAEMPLEVAAQVEAPAVEQPEGVLPGFPAPAPQGRAIRAILAEIEKIASEAEQDERTAFRKLDADGHLVAVTKTAVCYRLKKFISKLPAPNE